jgi:hypothetical protein
MGVGDYPPALKLFGGSACTWLITEYNPESRIFFGLCDLGLGMPELGYVSRDEIMAIRFPPFGLPIERDRSFKTETLISEYAAQARKLGRIKS